MPQVFQMGLDRDYSASWVCGHAIDYRDCAGCCLGWMSVGLGYFAFFRTALETLRLPPPCSCDCHTGNVWRYHWPKRCCPDAGRLSRDRK